MATCHRGQVSVLRVLFAAAVALLSLSCAPAAPPSPTAVPAKPAATAAQQAPAATAAAKPAAPTAVAAKPAATQAPAPKVDTKAIEDFYRGKTIRILVGYTAGGGFDLYSRAVANHLGKQIPGNPSVVVENMPGAASLIAANQVYKASQPDGLTLGVFNQQQVLNQLIGGQGIEFDARKFSWVGSAQSRVTACAARVDSGIGKFQDLLQANQPLIMGGTGPGSELDDFPKVMRAATGAKVKVVSGYQGSRQVKLAIDSKEVDGMCVSWASLKAEAADLLEQKTITVFAQQSLGAKHADLPAVPMTEEFAKTPELRQLLRAWSAPLAIGTPFVAPPGVPAARLAALQQAFLAVFKDPAFQADVQKQQLDVDPKSGDQALQVVNEILQTPAAIAKQLADVLNEKE